MLRWRDRPPCGTDTEDRAASLMRNAMVPGEPDDATLARIQRRLRDSRERPVYSRFAFRLVFAAFFLIAGVASVKAYEMIRRAVWPQQPTAPAQLPSAARRPATARVTRTPTAAAPDRAEPALADEATGPSSPPSLAPSLAQPAPIAERVPRDKPRPARQELAVNPESPPPAQLDPTDPPSRAWHPPAAPDLNSSSPTPSSTSPSEEVAVLDRAIALLRRDHNAEGALAALDAYLAHYPHGLLTREARLGRVDALLMLHRSDDALAALDSLPLDTHRRSTELQVIRGELRAQKDCRRAIADFSDAISHSPDAALLERILYGRGVCRAKTGDAFGAAADLKRYLERFPDAPHAAWARRWLESSSKATSP
jgi:hypothetical protein